MNHSFKFLFFGLGILLFIPVQEVKSQQADSLMKKIEGLSDYLLYRNHDTSYIANYGDKVAVKLVTVNKYNYFKIRDRIEKTGLRYHPVRDLSLGVGVSYQWFALDITFSLGLHNNTNSIDNRSFDFQGSLFSSKQYISTTVQYYMGYKLGNVRGVPVQAKEPSFTREDIRTINFSMQYMYALNYTKFSLKAPFVFNEVQRKSAGSAIAGISFSIFIMDADTSVVPSELFDYFDPALRMRDLNVLSIGLSFGYMYSLVYKERFFLSVSLIPGLNVNSGDYLTTTRELIPLNFNLGLNTMNAIGFNGKTVFAGANFIMDSFVIKVKQKMNVTIGSGRFNLFVGYRFGKKK